MSLIINIIILFVGILIGIILDRFYWEDKN